MLTGYDRESLPLEQLLGAFLNALVEEFMMINYRVHLNFRF